MQSTVQHITKTAKQAVRGAEEGRKGARPPVWRPQPSGLSRDELRAIILEQIG